MTIFLSTLSVVFVIILLVLSFLSSGPVHKRRVARALKDVRSPVETRLRTAQVERVFNEKIETLAKIADDTRVITPEERMSIIEESRRKDERLSDTQVLKAMEDKADRFIGEAGSRT